MVCFFVIKRHLSFFNLKSFLLLSPNPVSAKVGFNLKRSKVPKSSLIQLSILCSIIKTIIYSFKSVLSGMFEFFEAYFEESLKICRKMQKGNGVARAGRYEKNALYYVVHNMLLLLWFQRKKKHHSCTQCHFAISFEIKPCSNILTK